MKLIKRIISHITMMLHPKGASVRASQFQEVDRASQGNGPHAGIRPPVSSNTSRLVIIQY